MRSRARWLRAARRPNVVHAALADNGRTPAHEHRTGTTGRVVRRNASFSGRYDAERRIGSRRNGERSGRDSRRSRHECARATGRHERLTATWDDRRIPALAIVYGLTLGVLALAVLTSVRTSVPIAFFVRDPSVTLGGTRSPARYPTSGCWHGAWPPGSASSPGQFCRARKGTMRCGHSCSGLG